MGWGGVVLRVIFTFVVCICHKQVLLWVGFNCFLDIYFRTEIPLVNRRYLRRLPGLSAP